MPNRRSTISRPVAATTGRLALIAACVGLVVAATGCSSDDENSSSTTSRESDRRSTSSSADRTTTTQPGTTTATNGGEPASVEEEIVAQYTGYWNAWFDAASAPDPRHPPLAEYATSAQLDRVAAEIQALDDAGHRLRHADDPIDFQRVSVVSVNGASAEVQECYVDDDVVVRQDSGQVIDDDVTTQNVRGQMHLVDGRWLVDSVTVVQQWQEVAGCALAD